MRRRIAHVISTVHGVGGAEQLLGALAEEGERQGWDQLVLNPFVDDPAASLERLVGPDRYRGRPARGLGGLVATRTWVTHELDAYAPDLVHVLLFRAVVAVATLPRRRHVPRVQTHAYGEGVRLPPNARLKEGLDRWAGKRYDHSVVISTAGQRLLVGDYGYPTSKVTYIAPGWEGNPHPPSPPNEPTIVCVAKLRPEKGHDLLLAALQRVRQHIPAVRLVLVGEGVQRPLLEEQAAALGLSGCVHFAGAVPDIWPYLARAHVFALASRSEAFGIAAVEAMAAGLPVVGPATGGILDVVEPGVSGEVFPAGDHEALADRLIQLLGDRPRRLAMAQAAQLAAQRFQRAAALERYFQLFSELVERSPDGPTAIRGRHRSA